jgi:acetyltransferase
MRAENSPISPASIAVEGPSLRRVGELRALLSPGYLPAEACRELLSAYGLPVVRSDLVRSASAHSGADCGALDFSFFSYPVVAKIEHPDIVHKSDVGGVVLNIKDEAELKKTVDLLLKKFPGASGVLVQEQVRPGLELILGANSDPVLGHVLLVGAGGTGVEVNKDISMAHVPFGRDRAEKMLKNLRCWPLLKGYRGKNGVDLDALIGLMGKLERLLLDLPAIKELDLNPVIWDGIRFVIADFRVRV